MRSKLMAVQKVGYECKWAIVNLQEQERYPLLTVPLTYTYFVSRRKLIGPLYLHS